MQAVTTLDAIIDDIGAQTGTQYIWKYMCREHDKLSSTLLTLPLNQRKKCIEIYIQKLQNYNLKRLDDGCVSLSTTIWFLQKHETLDVFQELLHKLLNSKDYCDDDKLVKYSLLHYIDVNNLFWLEWLAWLCLSLTPQLFI